MLVFNDHPFWKQWPGSEQCPLSARSVLPSQQVTQRVFLPLQAFLLFSSSTRISSLAAPALRVGSVSVDHRPIIPFKGKRGDPDLRSKILGHLVGLRGEGERWAREAGALLVLVVASVPHAGCAT